MIKIKNKNIYEILTLIFYIFLYIHLAIYFSSVVFYILFSPIFFYIIAGMIVLPVLLKKEDDKFKKTIDSFYLMLSFWYIFLLFFMILKLN